MGQLTPLNPPLPGLLREMGHGDMPVAHTMVTAHLLVTWVSLLRTWNDLGVDPEPQWRLACLG